MPKLIDRGKHRAVIFGNAWICVFMFVLFLLLFPGTAAPVSAQSADPGTDASSPVLSLLPKEQTVSQNNRLVSLTVQLSPAPQATATVTVKITAEGEDSSLTITTLLSPQRPAVPVQFRTQPADIGRLLVTATAVTGGAPEPAAATATVIVKEQALVSLLPLMPVVPAGGEVRLRAEISSTPVQTVPLLLLATRQADGLLVEASLEFSSSVRTTEIVLGDGMPLPQGIWNITAEMVPVETVDPVVEPVRVRVRSSGLRILLLERDNNTLVPAGSTLHMSVILAEQNVARSIVPVTLPVTLTILVETLTQRQIFGVLIINVPGSFVVTVPPNQAIAALEIPAENIPGGGQISFSVGTRLRFIAGGRFSHIGQLFIDGRSLPITASGVGVIDMFSEVIRPDVSTDYGYRSGVVIFSHLVTIAAPATPMPCERTVSAILPRTQIVTGKPLEISILSRCAPMTTITVTVTARSGGMSIEKEFRIPVSIFKVTERFADSLAPGMWRFSMRIEDGTSSPPDSGVFLNNPLHVVAFDIVLSAVEAGLSPVSQPVQVEASLIDANGSPFGLPSTLSLGLGVRMPGMENPPVPINPLLQIPPGATTAAISFHLPAAGIWDVSVLTHSGSTVANTPLPGNIAPLEIEAGPRLAIAAIAAVQSFNSTLQLHVSASTPPHVPVAVTVFGRVVTASPPQSIPVIAGDRAFASAMNSNSQGILEFASQTVMLSPSASSADVSFAPSTLMQGVWIFNMVATPSTPVHIVTQLAYTRVEVVETRIRLQEPLRSSMTAIVGQSAVLELRHELPSSPVQLLVFRSRDGAEPESAGSVMLQSAAENSSGTVTFDVQAGEAGVYAYTLREPTGQDEVINEENYIAEVNTVARILLGQVGQEPVLEPGGDAFVSVQAVLVDINGEMTSLTERLSLLLQAQTSGRPCSSLIPPPYCRIGPLQILAGEFARSLTFRLPAAGTWQVSVRELPDAAGLVVPREEIQSLEVTVGPSLSLAPRANVLATSSTVVLQAIASAQPHTTVTVTVLAQVAGGVAEPVTRTVVLSPSASSADVSFGPGAFLPGRWIFSATAEPADALDARFATAEIIIIAPVRIVVDEPLQVLTLLAGQSVRLSAVFQTAPVPVTLNLFRALDDGMPEAIRNLTIAAPAAGASTAVVSFATGTLAQLGRYAFTLQEPPGQDVVANEDDFLVMVRVVADIALRRVTTGLLPVNQPVPVEAALLNAAANSIVLPATLTMTLQAVIDVNTATATVLPVTSSLAIAPGDSTAAVGLSLPFSGGWIISVTDIVSTVSSLVVPAGQVAPLEVQVGATLALRPEAEVLLASSAAVLRTIASAQPHTTVTVTVLAQAADGAAEPVTRTVVLSPSASSADASFGPGAFLPGRWIFSATAEPADALDTRFAMAEITVFAVPIRIEEPLVQSFRVLAGQAIQLDAVFQTAPVPVTLNLFRALNDGMPEAIGDLVIAAPAAGSSITVVSFATGALTQLGRYVFTLREPPGQDVVANEDDFLVTVRTRANIALRRALAGMLLTAQPIPIEAQLQDAADNPIVLPATVTMTLHAVVNASAEPVTSALTILPGASTAAVHMSLRFPGDWLISVADIAPPAAEILVVSAEEVSSLTVSVMDIRLDLTIVPMRASPGEQVTVRAELGQAFNMPLALEVAVRAPAAARPPLVIPIQPESVYGSALLVPDMEPGTWTLTVARNSALFIGAVQAELTVLSINLPELADPFAEINADDLMLALRYLVLCTGIDGSSVKPSACRLQGDSVLRMNLDAARYNLALLPELTLPELTGNPAGDGGLDDILLLLGYLGGVSPELLLPADTPERRLRLNILSQLFGRAE